MRVAVTILLSIAVGAGVLASGTLASGTPAVGPPLPAPIVIAAGPVSVEIARDERITRVRTPTSVIPTDAGWQPLTNTWYLVRRGGQLVVGRTHQAAWRSPRGFTSESRLGVIALGPRAVAFQHDHKLWLAPLDGSPRPVASRESPVGWTAGGGGLYTYGYPERALLLRSDSGKLVKMIAREPFGSVYFVNDGTLYFVSHGVLMSATGARTRRLASWASLGMSRNTWLQPVGSLLALEDDSRLVVLRPNGSVFASTPLREWNYGGISSQLVPAPDGSAVAFTATNGQTHAAETVYVLRPGSYDATAPYHDTVTGGVCAQGADVQWHGAWLLYSNVENDIAAVDTTGTHQTVDLTRLVNRLPGTRNGFTAHWSGEPPEL